tara:strand:+ start:744 stop:1367 length:624 start_codon:yes stop_codon:yes gene_type:complete
MKNLKAILLDADGVVFKTIYNVINKELKDLTDSEMEEVREVCWGKYYEQAKIGKVSDREMWLGTNSENGVFNELNIPHEKYNQFISNLRGLYALNEDALNFFNFARFAKLDLYMLSNSTYDLVEGQYEKFRLDNYFQKAFFSHKLGMAKPDKKIFDYALKNMDLYPVDVLFIDDKIRNINAADELGFKTQLFKNSEDYKNLKKLITS